MSGSRGASPGGGSSSTSVALHSAPPHPSRALAPQWLVAGEEKKAGSGILLFAYGDLVAVQVFLAEASAAARSLHANNPPSLQIGIVTNNASVDRALFTHHIVPREDLLFPGSNCPYGPKGCKPGKMRRQWATRLYYMAHSPFKLTWALDSNVVNCLPNAVGNFLDRALETKLWGFDIAHPSQANGHMYPHNWNIVYHWSGNTSDLMREWFMLQLRRGISADDQATLHVAERRCRAAFGLRVGQVPNALAAAFYSALPPKFYPRITRTVSGPVYLIHAKTSNPQEWCYAFNTESGTRQMYITADDRRVRVFQKASECRKALGVGKCPFAGAGHTLKHSLEVFEPLHQYPPSKEAQLRW